MIGCALLTGAFEMGDLFMKPISLSEAMRNPRVA